MLNSAEIQKGLENILGCTQCCSDKCIKNCKICQKNIIVDAIRLIRQYEKRIEELEHKLDDIEANDYY